VSDRRDDFSALSSDERVDRLRRLALRALERYDLTAPSLSLITNDWNCVFHVASGETSCVARVNLPGRRTRAEVEGEMAWLATLADGPIPVPPPVAARDGSLVVEAEDAGVPEPRMCVLFGWLDGVRLAEGLDADRASALGEATAVLHRQARSFPVPSGMHVWDSPFPFREPEVLFDVAHAAIVDARMRGTFERTRAVTVEAIARLRALEPPRMLHADLHEDNALMRPDGSIAILDFDDSMAGWPVQDLSVGGVRAGRPMARAATRRGPHPRGLSIAAHGEPRAAGSGPRIPRAGGDRRWRRGHDRTPAGALTPRRPPVNRRSSRGSPGAAVRSTTRRSRGGASATRRAG
jgi:Ser/Thr protein kinase RdoA (MazF antagonist)